MLKNVLSIVPAGFIVLALSGCAAEDNLAEDGDPPEVTCQRLHDTIDQFSDIDPGSMGFGDIFSHVSEGFTELETIADEAQDDTLAQSIDTMSETLSDSIASAGGNVDAVGAEFQERLQEPETQEAATYLQDACGTDLPF